MILLRIIGNSLPRRTKSIGILDLHNRVAYFETLILLRTLKIHRKYLRNKVPQSIFPPISLGIIKANCASIMTNLIGLES